MKDQVILLETAITANIKGFAFNDIVYPITQSSLQKWLREEHNIIVLVDKFMDKFICKVNNSIVTNDKTGDILKFIVYEDALEIGLIEGLNRI